MNTIDLVVLVVLGFNAILGAFRGFLRQSLGLAGVVLGVGAACAYYDTAALTLQSWFGLEGWSEFAVKAAGFFAVGLLVYAAGQGAAVAARKAAEKARMGGADRALGFAFGILKGGVICAVAFAAADIFVERLPETVRNEFEGGPGGTPEGSRAYRFFVDHVKTDAEAIKRRMTDRATQPKGK